MGDQALRLEQLISDTIQRSTEIILQRNGTIQPLYIDKEKDNKTSNEYISECCLSIVTLWKQDYISPLFIDIYISSDQIDGELLLIERWRILFQKNDDNKDIRKSSINRKIVTFLRSLQCFTRLLPGFLLLNYTTSLPNLHFDIYTPSTQNNNCTFSVETSTYQLPMIQTPKGALSVMVQYTQASVIQSFLQLAHATSFWSLSKMPRPKSSTSFRKNTTNFSDRNSNTEISPSKPIPISPNQLINDSKQRERSESIGSNTSNTSPTTGYSPMDKAISGKQVSKNSPSSGGSPFSTPPKQTSIASNFKRIPSNEKIPRDSFSYSPMPPFVLQEQYEKQQHYHHTGTSGIAIAGSFDDNFPIPPFPKKSTNLLSTSPQTNVWTLQANTTNVNKTNDSTKESILHIIREFESKLLFPKSPFDVIIDGCEINGEKTNEESNDLLFEKEKFKDPLFEVDDLDDNSLNDENMPFAFPNPNANSITLVSPTAQPITQLFMDVLVSFNDVEYPNGKELQKYILEQTNEIKKSL